MARWRAIGFKHRPKDDLRGGHGDGPRREPRGGLGHARRGDEPGRGECRLVRDGVHDAQEQGDLWGEGEGLVTALVHANCL